MIKVLFVCLGNICRSPMAEGVFKAYVKEKGLEDKFHFESRAISKWEEGRPVHPKTLEKLTPHQIDLTTKRSKAISELDFLDYDFIIGMDKKNIDFLKQFDDGAFRNKIHMYNKFKDVKDPYVTGNFEETYQRITKSMDKWIKKFEKTIKEKQVE
ncbi:low molecular weight protein-tyrosine-phosphatase [Acholeplasma hippikon]|uniref:protein-tyrosine-phosphatase n=1 Tax=Acholeplasma hippikon TaxID=264636 RepID=A0A449BLB4_9MOLU|nr:low molecular weight protein-tyrosine-phosphatase [Acholeplasma hippikon]VEU83230.1 Low molecular weight protein-tyrosine-phosphatase yfkJ [Acholeplasma hippikon]